MGIEVIKIPQTEPNAGLFNLPPAFDRKAHAASWIQAGGEVTAKQERQPIYGTNMSADGWQPWKDDKGKICKVATKKQGEFVLMFRPREVQDAVNAICGNVGKQIMSHEKEGTTVGGQAPIAGVLTNEQLERYEGRLEGEEGKITLNKIDPRILTEGPVTEITT